jgi:arylsulfatase A-like enzyme
VGLVGLAGLVACAPAPRRATPETPNVLWIVVDTLRADAVGAYGNPRGLTPRIDRLGAEGVVFENAFSSAPWTLPSFASMFTSQPPQSHGAGGRADDYRGLDPSIPTLPAQLREAGYATAAIANVEFLARPFGVTRGFDHLDVQAFENNTELRDAHQTTDAAVNWLEGNRDSAFLLLVHYFDAHAEYRPPAAYRARFAAEQDRADDSFRFGTRSHVIDRRAGRMELLPEVVERAHRLYEAEVAFVDDEIGRLIDRLSALGLDENTLVIVTSDHGEEFLDHGDWEHGHTLYDELLRVPLVLRQTGRLAPRRVEATVGLVDLAPTILERCGLSACKSFRGRDLSPALSGRDLPEAELLSYGNFWGPPLSGLRFGDLAFVQHPDGRAELFRWTSDPSELDDRSTVDPAGRDRIQDHLQRAQAEAFRVGHASGPRVRLTAEETRRLSAVGYAGDGAVSKD